MSKNSNHHIVIEENENIATLDNVVRSIRNMNEVSIADEEMAKDVLVTLNKKMKLMSDGRKMKQADILYNCMDEMVDIIGDREKIRSIGENLNTPQDLKMFAEAYEKLQKSAQQLNRLDSVDIGGNASNVKIGVFFEDDRGLKVQTITQIGDN